MRYYFICTLQKRQVRILESKSLAVGREELSGEVN